MLRGSIINCATKSGAICVARAIRIGVPGATRPATPTGKRCARHAAQFARRTAIHSAVAGSSTSEAQSFGARCLRQRVSPRRTRSHEEHEEDQLVSEEKIFFVRFVSFAIFVASNTPLEEICGCRSVLDRGLRCGGDELATDGANGRQHPIDVAARAAIVHDARAQHEAAAQLGAGQERLAAKLQTFEQPRFSAPSDASSDADAVERTGSRRRSGPAAPSARNPARRAPSRRGSAASARLSSIAAFEPAAARTAASSSTLSARGSLASAESRTR